MAVFAYKAVDVQRQSISGVVTADTPRQARDRLRHRGLTVQAVTPRASKKRAWSRIATNRDRNWLIDLSRELSTLLSVGVPLLEALDTIASGLGGKPAQPQASSESDKQTNRRLHHWRKRFSRRGARHAFLLRLKEDVSSGLSLADAMREQPEVFDHLSIHLCEVGEHTGNLESVLHDLADFKEKSSQLRGKVTTALIYPAIVLVTGLLVTLFLMTIVVPNLLDALVEEGRPLPTITLIVKSISDLLIERWWVLLLSTVLSLTAFLALISTTRGKMVWHTILLRTPALGELIRKQAVVHIAVVMATMMRSGVTFMKAIEVVQRSTPNLVLRRGLHQCEQAVGAGRDISKSLDAARVFPPTMLQVFQIGQETGRLEEMLERLAQDYDRQVTTATGRFTAALEPVLIIALALIVGAIAFATILPILEAGNVL